MAVARKPGVLKKEHLGLAVAVKSKYLEESFDLEEELSDGDDPVVLCNEVKRLGFLVDRKQTLQVRVGDSLLIYLSKSAT